MNKIKLFLSVLIAVALFGCQPTPSSSDVFVTHVQDGDSFKATENGKDITIRLFGVDCPEKGMDYANKAKKFTKQAIEGKTITYQMVEKDRYDRIIARVYTEDGKLLNLELLENGLAHHYTRYSNDKDFAAAEKMAKANKMGLWSMNKVVKPWDYRKSKRN